MQTQLSRSIRCWTLYIFVLTAVIANGGCIFLAAGAAGGAAVGYAYARGRVYENYNARLDDGWAATQTALKELGMPILSEERKADSGFIESRTADNEKVRIYVDDVSEQLSHLGPMTQISVRVATFGDREFSNRLLDQVGLHLVPATGQPVAAQPAPQVVVRTAAPALASPSSPAAAGTAAPAPATPPAANVITPQQTPPPPLAVR